MNLDDLARTRRSLHAVAEHVLAGPQHAVSDTVRLRVVEGGFATSTQPDVRLRDGHVEQGPTIIPVDGATSRQLLDGLGLSPSSLAEVYDDRTDVALDDPLTIDPAAYAVLVRAWGWGDAALRDLAAGPVPVLWPEHFDVAISVDEVNYGVSPGDTTIAEPYAYVGPWSPPPVGGFWTHSFGAARTVAELGSPEALADFLHEGRRLTGAGAR
jgi:hypothetical protein